MQRFFKETLGLALFVLYKIITLRKPEVISIYFHNPPPSLFERIIKYLIARSYSFISLDKLSEIIDDRRITRKSAIITIDDGWENNILLLEIMRKYNVPSTIFITTAAIENGNFWWEYVGHGKKLNKASLKKEIIRIKRMDHDKFISEISKLKSGVKIKRSALTKDELLNLGREKLIILGSHTVNHLSLPGKPYEIQKKELLDSKSALELITGEKIDYLSYPSGDFDQETISLAKECGYKLCFTIDPVEFKLSEIDKFSVPRRCVNDDAGFFEALAKIYGIWYRFIK